MKDLEVTTIPMTKAEERARSATMLFTMNQRVFHQLSKRRVDEDLYSAIAGLMMAAENARRLLGSEVTE